MATVDISDKTVHQDTRDLFTTLIMLDGSEVYDAGSIADGNEETGELTITGAALGDFVLVSHSVDVADLAITGAVTAANTVTYQLNNNTGGSVDLASGTVYARVFKRGDVLGA